MRNRLAISVVIAAAAVAGATAVVTSGDERSPALIAEHPVTVPEEPRTVLVSRTMPLPSAHARRLSAMLEQGTLPPGTTGGEVLTDTDCVPDQSMVSRCRNEVALPGGERIVLRHPHDMTEVPCLAPGEKVRLVALDA